VQTSRGKHVVALLGAALALSAVLGCGGSASQSDGSSRTDTADPPANVHVTMGSRAASPFPPDRPGIHDAYDGDDSAGREVEQGDDLEAERYGRPANAAERRLAIRFVSAYFTAASREDGAAGCALLEPALAQGLPGSYRKPGPLHYLEGASCAAVMHNLFVHRRRLISAEARGLEVTGVRTTGGTVFVLLAFRGIRERRFMGLHLQGGRLELEALLDSPYP
jgi:hypothetical protein